MADVDLTLLKRFSEDRAAASAALFSHRHPQVSSDFHFVMHDLWRSANEFILFEAFREAAKTTTAEEYLILEGCYGNSHYGLIIGETYTKACSRLDAIDKECRMNIKLHHLFGGPVLARKSTENRIWFKSGCLFEAWGWEQELQSFKYRDFRPDLAYLDDIENQERVRDKEAVDSGMKKFWLELLPAMDKTRRRIRFGQTRRAEDCMVTRFAKSDQWLYYGVPICDRDPDDPEAISNWPARYPIDWIRAEKKRYQESGMLSYFLQSYMLQAVNPADKPFKGDWGEMDVSPWHWMPRFVIYDPARTSNEKRGRGINKSDRYGKVVVSRLGSKILVHESSGSHWQPNEFINDLFVSQDKHSPVKIGVEKNSLDDWLMQPIRIESMKRGVSLPMKPLQAPQDRSKEQFIMGLQPFSEAKDLVLVGGAMAHPELVAEKNNFPSGPRDVLNALAYSLTMFAGTPVYEDFSGANIGDAPNPKIGEIVYVAFNASQNETIAVAVVREGRRLCVAADWAASGSINDAVKTLAFDLRSTFPRADIQVYCPADVYDQWQRIPLVPALRNSRFNPYRAELSAVSRGCLSDRIRNTWRQSRLFLVDKRAKLTLNSLAAGYALPVERGGRSGAEPEQGISRLVAEGLESLISFLDKTQDAMSTPKNANVAVTPGGQTYVTANPRR